MAIYLMGKTSVIYGAIMEGLWTWLFLGAFIGQIYFAAHLYNDPDNNITTGELVTYLLYNFQIIGEVMGFTNNLQMVFTIRGAFYEMAKLILEKDYQEGYHDRKEVTEEMT